VIGLRCSISKRSRFIFRATETQILENRTRITNVITLLGNQQEAKEGKNNEPKTRKTRGTKAGKMNPTKAKERKPA
jgi:hypothetical protein